MPVTSKDGKALVCYWHPRTCCEHVAWLIRYEKIGKFLYAVLRKPGTNLTFRVKAAEVGPA